MICELFAQEEWGDIVLEKAKAREIRQAKYVC
jgi:hypothetical protein